MLRCDERRKAVVWTVAENEVGQANVVGEFLKRNHANVEACSGSRLENVFGMQTLFSANADDMQVIRDTYAEELASLNPVLHFVRPDESERAAVIRRHNLVVFAYDEVGVVADLTAALADLKIDIAHLASCQYPAPQAGIALFVVEMKVDVPRSAPMRSLRAVLNSFEAERGWDVEFTPERPSDASVPSRAFPPSREMLFSNSSESNMATASRN